MSAPVCVVLSSRPTDGGANGYSRDIVRALAETAATWPVVGLGLRSEWEPIVRAAGLPYVNVRSGIAARLAAQFAWKHLGSLSLWKTVARSTFPLLSSLRGLEPQLVIYPCEPRLALLSGGKRIAPIHDLMYLYESQFSEVGSSSQKRKRYEIDRSVAESGAMLLADSNIGRQHLVESLNARPDRVGVLPFISRDWTKVDATPVKLPFDRYIFYPAQMWKHKNHRKLLHAMSLLKQQGLIVNAVFCGVEKNASQEFWELVGSSGLREHVAHLGYAADSAIKSLYSSAVALVMPTYFGPTNIPPLEAFAIGCPVAVSDIYGMREQCGEAAIYFDPNSSEQIAKVIAYYWQNESGRREMSLRGLKRAAQWTPQAFGQSLSWMIQYELHNK